LALSAEPVPGLVGLATLVTLAGLAAALVAGTFAFGAIFFVEI